MAVGVIMRSFSSRTAASRFRIPEVPKSESDPESAFVQRIFMIIAILKIVLNTCADAAAGSSAIAVSSVEVRIDRSANSARISPAAKHLINK